MVAIIKCVSQELQNLVFSVSSFWIRDGILWISLELRILGTISSLDEFAPKIDHYNYITFSQRRCKFSLEQRNRDISGTYGGHMKRAFFEKKLFYR